MEIDVQDGVIPYDLRSQDRIIRGRMPTLEIIHDRFVRMFRITLSAALRKPVDVSVRSTELIKFGEFLRTLPVPASLNLYRMNPLRGTAIMVLETRLVFSLLDIFYGGTGQLEVKAQGRDFTAIEQRLVKRVVISGLEDLQTAWRPVFPVQISYQRTEINPQFVAVVPQSEVVIVITFDVEMGKAPMTLTLCIPYSMVEPIRRILDSGFQSDQGEKGTWAERFARSLGQAKVPLVAKTECRPISIRDFVNLKEGDFLLSDKKPDQPLDVYIHGVRKMTGMMREDKGRQTVEIEDVFQARPSNVIAELRKKADELSRIAQSSAVADPAQASPSQAETSRDPSEAKFSLQDFLKDSQPEMVVDLIKFEHPQTITLILAHIDDPGKTAGIIERLPQNLMADVTYRLAILESIPPGVFKEIEEVLGREIQTKQLYPSGKIGGIKPAGRVLKSMETKTGHDILATIRESNPDLADRLEESMKDVGR
ncbi:MAG: flagellar motor switch protein FliM [Proteobacteria bacterium]|nr:flagellar motor switch protein FliM [Pseudomonadota bacterium]